MNLTPPKLKPLHIGILAVLLAAIVGGAAAYLWIVPLVKNNTATQATVDDLETQANPANVTLAQKKLADANKTAARSQNEWRIEEARYCRIGPKNDLLDLSDPYSAAEYLFIEQQTECTAAIAKWVKGTGNTITAYPTVKGPLEGPNPNNIDPKLNKLSLEGLKVQGTFPSILRLLKSTRSCPRLVSIDSVNLTSAQSQTQDSSSIGGEAAPSFMFGNGDTVVAEMHLTVYIYPINGDKVKKVLLPGADTTGGTGTLAPAGGMPGGPAAGPSLGPRPGGPSMPGSPRPGGPPIG